MKPEILITGQGRKIAYHQTKGEGAGIVFLGGFSSDMDGSKAIHMEHWAKKRNNITPNFRPTNFSWFINGRMDSTTDGKTYS